MKASIAAVTAFFVALPFLYLASVYGELPDRVPIHFDWRGQPDGYGPKYILWVLPALMVPLALLTAAALRKKIDGPVLTDKRGRIGLVTIVSMSALFCYLIYGTARGGFGAYAGLSILMGLMFAAQGNYLPVLPRNKWIGIRVPPTLRSDYKWRKTHRMAGPIFLGGGLLLVVNGLLLSFPLVNILMFVILAVMVVIPLVYAYRLEDEPPSDLV